MYCLSSTHRKPLWRLFFPPVNFPFKEETKHIISNYLPASETHGNITNGRRTGIQTAALVLLCLPHSVLQISGELLLAHSSFYWIPARSRNFQKPGSHVCVSWCDIFGIISPLLWIERNRWKAVASSLRIQSMAWAGDLRFRVWITACVKQRNDLGC